MRQKRFTEELIIGVRKEHEAGIKAAEICRKRCQRLTPMLRDSRTKGSYMLWKR